MPVATVLLYWREGSRWSKEEDTLLIQKTANQGHFDWSEISKLFPERSSEACRTHYYGGVNKNVSQRAESESSIRSAIPRVNVPRLN